MFIFRSVLKFVEIMKAGIHPTLYPVIFRDTNAGQEFKIYSTLVTEEKEVVNGEECYIERVDISSASHPFYTGKQNLVDTSGRVDKFKAKMARAAK